MLVPVMHTWTTTMLIRLPLEPEDEEAIRDILRDAKVKPSDINLDVVNTKEREKDPKC